MKLSRLLIIIWLKSKYVLVLNIIIILTYTYVNAIHRYVIYCIMYKLMYYELLNYSYIVPNAIILGINISFVNTTL